MDDVAATPAEELDVMMQRILYLILPSLISTLIANLSPWIIKCHAERMMQGDKKK